MKPGFVRDLVYALARQPIPTHEYAQATTGFTGQGIPLWQHTCGHIEAFTPEQKAEIELDAFLAALPPATPRRLLHSEEETTCRGFETSEVHLERLCEDCDVVRMSRCSLGEIEDRYHVGRISQDQYEAYSYAWALLSPTGSRPEWRTTPEDPTVRRIARKLIRVKGFEVPAELAVTR